MEIILIGLGASGVSFLTQLSRSAKETRNYNIKVKVISTKDYFSKGKAFGASKEIHLMNTLSSTMGLDILDDKSYIRWLEQKGLKVNSYTKRLEYSQYISECYSFLKSESIINIEEFRSEAVSIDITDMNDIVITTSKNENIKGDCLIYAPGTVNSDNFAEISYLENFHHNLDDLNSIPKNSSVGILGSGLTSVDAIRELVESGHYGKISLYSRSGNAPTCISMENRYTPNILTFENILKNFSKTDSLSISSLKSLLNKEVKDVKHEVLEAKKRLNKNVGDYWRYLYSRANNADLPFQDILVSTRPYAHKVWSLLNDRDKLIFNTRHSSSWATWRHPIPTKVIKELYELHDFGQLDIFQLTSKPRFENKGFFINTTQGLKQEEYLIDATGGSHQVLNNKDLFLNSLLLNGLANRNLLGGIDVDSHTYRVKNNKTNNIFAIGQIAKGSLFATNAFWFNAKVANGIVKYLINDLSLNNIKEKQKIA